MEIFLLLLDEIDDAFGVLRSYARRIMGFTAALLLFCTTGFLMMRLSLLAIALFATSMWLLFLAAQARSRGAAEFALPIKR